MEHTNSNLPSVTTDFDEKPKIDLSNKKSVKSYATRVFQESTVGIVSSTFTTHSKCRRLFKVLISSLCIAFFIYHCVVFLNHVLGYPEVVNISLDRSETYNWPAYTYCSNNPINRKTFCRLQPKHCDKPSTEFCKKYSSYCGDNETLVPKERYYYELPMDYQAEWILNFHSKVLDRDQSYITESKFEKDVTSGPYLRFSGSYQTPKACYSIHSHVESKQQPMQKRRRQEAHISISRAYDDKISFYLKETEMMSPTNEPGVYFSVHSPFEAGHPLENGIYMKGGRTYKIYVELHEELLLKAPFESNCLDYDELWIKNNRTGPRTRKMCNNKCNLDYTAAFEQCASRFNQYPHKMWICGDEITGNLTTPSSRPLYKNYKSYILNCGKSCRDECRSSKYKTEYSIMDYVAYYKPEEQRRHIEVEIYLSNDEIKVLRHSPKYETVDVISSIGGFMGCWLGIALMDILDVFGSIIIVCGYAFRKKLTKKFKRRQSM